MDNLYTKYEVSMFTHYEDMKGDEKYTFFVESVKF